MLTMCSALFKAPGGYPFGEIIDKCVTASFPDDLDKAERGFLVLWGGEDISPALYNAKRNSRTGAADKLSRRDWFEKNLVMAAIEREMLIVGICRGAQLMCALSGGKLIQHCSGHAGHGDHLILTNEGEQYVTTSLHHQMLYPYDVEHELIAWTNPPLSKEYFMESEYPIEMPAASKDVEGHVCEPEIVYFPKTRALCIQGHPEYMDLDTPFVKYCNDLVKKYAVE